MNRTTIFLGLAVMAATLTGCNDAAKKNENALLSENRGLRDRLTQSQADFDAVNDENRRLKYQLDEANQKLTDAASSPPAELTAFAPGVSVLQRGNETILRIEGDVLFDSGRDSLKSTAKSTLSAIAANIEKAYPNSRVMVTGYTDSDPIKKSGHKSNYHLGFSRAYAVGQYLGSHGINSDRISYSTNGPLQPLETKAKSRRVEVSVFTDSD